MTRSTAYRSFIERLSIRTRDLQVKPLRFNEAQEIMWRSIQPRLDERKKLWLIILKARRLGISTLLQSLMFSRTVFHDRVHSLTMASNAGNTAEIWNMAEMMAMYSPFRPYVRKVRRELKIGNSKYTVATAGTPDATRGFDLTCLHASENAFWPFHDTMLAVMQCLPDHLDSFCFVESTANGKIGDGKLFHDLWQAAVAGENEFTPIFLPWHALSEYAFPGYVYKHEWRPGIADEHVVDTLENEEQELVKQFKLSAAQLAWWRYCLATKCQGDHQKRSQEYPSTSAEAFIVSGLPFFSRADLLPFQAHLRKGKKYRIDGSMLREDPRGYFEVFTPPQSGHKYIAASDSSMGIEDEKETRSKSTIEVLDMETLEQVAEYEASTSPHILAKHLVTVCKYYNDALAAPEVNPSGGGGGRELILFMQEQGYWNIYRDTARHSDRVKKNPGIVYGWECLDPEAKVLTADLQWIEARQLKIGENLIGCEEATWGGKEQAVRLRVQQLANRCMFVAPKFRVTLVNGQQTIVSGNHPFWARRSKKGWEWILAERLQPGNWVKYIAPWETVRTYETGMLRAFLDGEGHLCKGKLSGFQLLISQAEGPLAQEIRELWETLGFETTFKWLRHKKRPHEKPIAVSGVLRLPEVMRALGMSRPSRLLRKFINYGLAGLTMRSVPNVVVESVEPLGDGPVVGLTTEPNHTLVADGIIGHNTNRKTRDRMLSRLRQVVQTRQTIIHSEKLLTQLQNFGMNDAGRYEAETGHDDLLMAYGIGVVVRTDNYFPQSTSTITPTLDELASCRAAGLHIQEYDVAEALVRHRDEVLKGPRVEHPDHYLNL